MQVQTQKALCLLVILLLLPVRLPVSSELLLRLCLPESLQVHLLHGELFTLCLGHIRCTMLQLIDR